MAKKYKPIPAVPFDFLIKGHEGVTAYREYIATRTGIELFKNDQVFNIVVLASEVRNLIAHNDCRVNDIFLRRIADIKDVPLPKDTDKFEITDEWLRTTSYTLDAVVFDFDEAAATKFNLETLNRGTTFIFRT
jgi:hypothetical protein